MIPRSKHLAIGALAFLFVMSQMSGQVQGWGAQAPRSGAAMSTGGASAPALMPEYRIGPEDVLDIVVIGHDDLTSRGMQVRPDGRITLSLVNDIQAAGLTAMELRASIIKGLDPFWKDQQVSVSVKEVHSAKVSIVGQVKIANRYELRSQLTVVEVIAMAGGLLDYAESDKIFVQRVDGTRVPFNYKKFMSDPASQPNFALKAGDIVIVP